MQSHREKPLVSIIIPTRNRPNHVLRAVRSALAQTYTNIEVVVAVDGPDTETISVLRALGLDESVLHIVTIPCNVGGADARNIGIKASHGEWIALLDDDDEWISSKLERQIALGVNSTHDLPVISCKVIARTPARDYTWPSKEPFLPIADFLFRRRSVFWGEGVLQTSTLVARREIFIHCPFTSGLRKHQDWDWIIRACNVPGVQIEFLGEPLSIWHIEENRQSVGWEGDWRYSLRWAETVRPGLTPEAYASFLLTVVGASASNQKEPDAFWPVLLLAVKKGKPSVIHVALFLGMWLFPKHARRRLRSVLSRSGKDGRLEGLWRAALNAVRMPSRLRRKWRGKVPA
jgi:glycosyltransferase involved in cell wall biosynthesis